MKLIISIIIRTFLFISTVLLLIFLATLFLENINDKLRESNNSQVNDIIKTETIKSS